MKGVGFLPNKRDLKLDQYGISKERYRELYYFCLQYQDFLKEKQSCYSLDGNPINGMPRGNNKSDPTGSSAEKAYKLGKNIDLIEQTVIEACGRLYPWMLKFVTEEIAFMDLNPPCGKQEFYDERRKFYFLLSLKK